MRKLATVILWLVGCSHGCGSAQEATELPETDPVVISVVGTSDIQGFAQRLPAIASYVQAVRQRRAEDGGVLLVDSGDMWQGTFLSNLTEGEPVQQAMEAMGYRAAAIGNHEFDYGPRGPEIRPREEGDDRRGLLKHRAARSSFPYLAANLVEGDSGEPVSWENVRPSTIVTVAGIEIGLVGVLTTETARYATEAVMRGLEVAPLAPAIVREARALREDGATVVIVLAHAGGRCSENTDPDDTSSCNLAGEIFEVARELPEGLVDAICAGHEHAPLAHRYQGIPIVAPDANAASFSRVDLFVDPATGRVSRTHIHGPHPVCIPNSPDRPCEEAEYENQDITESREVLRVVEPYLERTRTVLDRQLPERMVRLLRDDATNAVAAGNLYADLVHAAQPATDIVLVPADSLRLDPPEGPPDIGWLYRALPFDSAYVELRLDLDQLRQLIVRALAQTEDLGVSGLRIRSDRVGDETRVALMRPDGEELDEDAMFTVILTHELALAGTEAETVEDLWGPRVAATHLPIREAVAPAIAAGEQPLASGGPPIHDPDSPRIQRR